MKTVKKQNVQKSPTRKEVPTGDTWDLTTLYANDVDWEKDFKKYEKEHKGYSSFEGKLRLSRNDSRMPKIRYQDGSVGRANWDVRFLEDH